RAFLRAAKINPVLYRIGSLLDKSLWTVRRPSCHCRTVSCAAQRASQQCGRAHTFVAAILLILVWAISGPAFHYYDTWQLIINTATTIITFLMVFLIQNTQSGYTAAIPLKLDELIRAIGRRSGRSGEPPPSISSPRLRGTPE